MGVSTVRMTMPLLADRDISLPPLIWFMSLSKLWGGVAAKLRNTSAPPTVAKARSITSPRFFGEVIMFEKAAILLF